MAGRVMQHILKSARQLSNMAAATLQVDAAAALVQHKEGARGCVENRTHQCA